MKIAVITGSSSGMGRDFAIKVFDCTVLLEMQSKVYIIAA